MEQEAEKEVRKLADQAARNFRAEFGEEISGLRNQVVQMQEMIRQLERPNESQTEEGTDSNDLLKQLREFGQKSQQQQQQAYQQLQQSIQQAVQLLGQAVKYLQTSQVLSQMNILIEQSEQQLRTNQEQGKQFQTLGKQYMQQGQQGQILQ
ncbi:hypothetical protein [Alicyclobacillus fastidiosus]|uniref:Uncharacterized protein n=1 Tax=Alicyclobacillus fastidiosus TaxID=392011 RepID=A0ABV5A9I4_9BACL|nr:hypothetical protein [Alicyclobacillus fastidiosus]WEH10867.1 hypothetical protein PYS47_06525 [Alicyclobacillus fastidiosus]